jgi:hypothetical protein
VRTDDPEAAAELQMMEWRTNGTMCGSFGCFCQSEGLCFGIQVERGQFSRRGRTEVAYRIKGKPQLFGDESDLMTECRRVSNGQHGPQYLEVARLRRKCLENGIDPDEP